MICLVTEINPITLHISLFCNITLISIVTVICPVIGDIYVPNENKIVLKLNGTAPSRGQLPPPPLDINKNIFSYNMAENWKKFSIGKQLHIFLFIIKKIPLLLKNFMNYLYHPDIYYRTNRSYPPSATSLPAPSLAWKVETPLVPSNPSQQAMSKAPSGLIPDRLSSYIILTIRPPSACSASWLIYTECQSTSVYYAASNDNGRDNGKSSYCDVPRI